jgi:hypothetical protein
MGSRRHSHRGKGNNEMAMLKWIDGYHYSSQVHQELRRFDRYIRTQNHFHSLQIVLKLLFIAWPILNLPSQVHAYRLREVRFKLAGYSVVLEQSTVLAATKQCFVFLRYIITQSVWAILMSHLDIFADLCILDCVCCYDMNTPMIEMKLLFVKIHFITNTPFVAFKRMVHREKHYELEFIVDEMWTACTLLCVQWQAIPMGWRISAWATSILRKIPMNIFSLQA